MSVENLPENRTLLNPATGNFVQESKQHNGTCPHNHRRRSGIWALHNSGVFMD